MAIQSGISDSGAIVSPAQRSSTLGSRGDCDRPGVLRARLDGPADRRAAQAARLGGLELEEATETVKRHDRAHAEYTRRFYGADIYDPALYDIVVDSTRIDLATCLELLEVAARARAH